MEVVTDVAFWSHVGKLEVPGFHSQDRKDGCKPEQPGLVTAPHCQEDTAMEWLVTPPRQPEQQMQQPERLFPHKKEDFALHCVFFIPWCLSQAGNKHWRVRFKSKKLEIHVDSIQQVAGHSTAQMGSKPAAEAMPYSQTLLTAQEQSLAFQLIIPTPQTKLCSFWVAGSKNATSQWKLPFTSFTAIYNIFHNL